MTRYRDPPDDESDMLLKPGDAGAAMTMPETAEKDRVAVWNRDLRERVGEPLRPEALGSVLIVIQGHSGDVVLASTLVRHIKGLNPRCRITFAVKRSNLPFLRMCPGVDEAIEAPEVLALDVKPGRTPHQAYLAHYAGRADAVIYPVRVFEDTKDLLGRYNFLEAMWLLAGVPDGVPREPQALWLVPPDDPSSAVRALRRCLSRGHAARLVAEAGRQPGKMLRRVVSLRRVRDVGWKDAPEGTMNLLRNAAYVAKLPTWKATPDGDGLAKVAKRFVIVSREAASVPPRPKSLFRKVIHFLRSQGRIVLQNVMDPARAAPGTVPLVCSYEEFMCLRAAGIPFVGWRSGLCDIAAISPAPMAVLYPATMTGFNRSLWPDCESVLKAFGFASMKVAANCVELSCDSADEVDLDKLATILD